MALYTRDQLLKENLPMSGGFFKSVSGKDESIVKPTATMSGGFFYSVVQVGTPPPPISFNPTQFFMLF